MKTLQFGLQKEMTSVFDESCLLQCYIWMALTHLGKVPDPYTIAHYVIDAYSKGLVARDGFVEDAEKLMRELFGIDCVITHGQRFDDGPTIWFAKFTKSHALIVDGQDHDVVLFDPYINSLSGKYGVLETSRNIEWR